VFSSGGGLRSPAGIVFGADGDLYVGSYDNGRVLRYDGVSGQFVGAFAGGEELVQPVDVAFGPDGNLYVSAYGIWGKTDTGILRYDGMSGELIDVFATEGTRQPAGLLFVPDGGLFVAEHWNGNILRFDGGGTLQSVFAERTAPTFMVLIPEPATLCLMLAGLLLMGKGR
jgi:streptogramin lyase